MSLRDTYHTLASTPSDSLLKVYKVKALGKHLHTPREGEIERVSVLCAAKVVQFQNEIFGEALFPSPENPPEACLPPALGVRGGPRSQSLCGADGRGSRRRILACP